MNEFDWATYIPWISLGSGLLAAIATAFAAYASCKSAATAKEAHKLQSDIERINTIMIVKKPVLDTLNSLQSCLGALSGFKVHDSHYQGKSRDDVVKEFNYSMDSLMYLDGELHHEINEWFQENSNHESPYITLHQTFARFKSVPNKNEIQLMQRKSKELEEIKERVMKGKLK